ncbi:Nnp-1 [Drosophila busckii]|uniref:Nnp-1 n=1 Tax=Drosophila busckii TaxID=30019 RepID=A0A0M4EDM1_DROBS|nr:ribosomal RNA processing protein 1 homolog [Drosophila busckii]ALC39960.1 Nnp-1 [Drosophila busckii]
MVTRKAPIKRSAQLAAIDKANESDDEGASQPKVPKELLVIAQEVKIVRALACNDLTKRNRQLRKLRKWFQLRARSSFPFTEDDFMRIWKGLYYNVWMSDKPLVQEDLAEQLAQMIDSFDGNTACSLAYFSAFMRTMCQEWFGIDQWRMDKFLMLVRRMLRYMLRLLKAQKWPPELIESYNATMLLSVLAEQPKSRGLTMHYMDIFFEELAKAANEEITAAQVNLFLRPFVRYMGTQRDAKLVAQCRTRVLYQLLYQSELGREYSEKYKAWKEMGFPTASIDDVEKLDSGFDEEEDELDEEQQPEATSLDPRAGNVDVLMPELPLNADAVLDELQTLLRTQEYNTKKRKGLRKLVHIFETYAGGEFPLGVRNMPKPEGATMAELVEQKVAEGEQQEEDTFGTGRKLKKLTKAKRKRLLKSINFEEVNEDNYEEIINRALSPKLREQVKRNEKVRSSIQNAWVVEKVEEEGKPEQDGGAEPKAKQKTKAAKKPAKSQSKTQPQQKKLKQAAADEEALTSTTTAAASAAETVTTTETPNEETAVAAKEGKASNGWEEALQPGEMDYFVPSRKVQLKQANKKLSLNPAAQNSPKTPVERLRAAATPQTGSAKRVRIMIKQNSAYPKSDYYRQLKLSPQLPYDANRLPGKSALKPHVLPGPINPNFKKKRLFNDTL